MAEIDVKTDRLVRLARAAGLGGILLHAQRNVAWLTGGRSNRVDGSREAGAGALVVSASGRRLVVANAIEMPRLMNETVAGLGFEAIEYPWIDDQSDPAAAIKRAQHAISAPRIGADGVFPDAVPIEGAMTQLRAPLIEEEVARYRSLGREMGVAIGGFCNSVRPGTTEQEIAGELSAVVSRAGARPIVVLIAADERIRLYRHPVPSDTVWRDTLLVVLCAERHGLVVSLSRIVCLSPPSTELSSRTDATAQVFARLLDATRTGTTGAELYSVAVSAYEANGFAGEEVRHHQGGATGYRSREWVAHPHSAEVVQAAQAFAWNPSITGTKIEDTVLLIDGKYENLTATPGWPEIAFEAGGQPLAAAGLLRR
jgi:Xaa-Pro aminopeptidase